MTGRREMLFCLKTISQRGRFKAISCSAETRHTIFTYEHQLLPLASKRINKSCRVSDVWLKPLLGLAEEQLPQLQWWNWWEADRQQRAQDAQLKSVTMWRRVDMTKRWLSSAEQSKSHTADRDSVGAVVFLFLGRVFQIFFQLIFTSTALH